MRYIGSKTNLLEEIDILLKKHVQGDEKVFLDLFAGTNAVGRYFKDEYEIITNDLLYFSFVNAKATIENNISPTFKNLKFDPFEYLNNDFNAMTFKESHYYSYNYTPLGDAMYITEENGLRIDFIRYTINSWLNDNLINNTEYYYLLSCLIEAIPYISNITGTYGAFLKHWDKRALNKLILEPLEVKDNYKNNKAYNIDSNLLVRELEVDICYIDIPYNKRQYASNYHLLENIARDEQPELRGKTKIFEWSPLKSKYSMTKNAYEALEDLITNLKSTHVILSYNDEGIIPFEDIYSLLKNSSIDGNVDVVKIPYRKYKSKITSQKSELYEYLFYIKKYEKKSYTPPQNINNKSKLIKSPLNYIGGKHRLLNQILPLFPQNITTFVDLFSGGANVGINVTANKHIFVDMNDKINEMFRYFANMDVNELIKMVENRIAEFNLSKTNEESYINFRKMYNTNPNPLDLYVLISYSYNYQIRFNNNMIYNNPFGKNRSHFSENMKNNLLNFVSKLQSLDYTFLDMYFQDFDISSLDEESFVYLDPPYIITTGSYNDGNRGFTNWNENQEIEMYNLMCDLTNNNIRYALSNVLTHKSKEHHLLKQFANENNVQIHYLTHTYKNSSYNTQRLKSEEVLVTNYDPVTFKILK